jgi:YD repeat-containing protein
MAYDAANNLQWSAQGQTITDGTCGQSDVAGGAQTARTYDAMNRVKTITPPAGTQSTSYTYDVRGNISNVVSGSATNTFGYNSRNLLTSQTLSVGGYAWGIAYSYDSYGHVSAVGYPAYNSGSEGVAYSPDALGRPTQVASYANGITYFPNDQVAGFNYGNGASYVAEQNARQLLSNFSYGAGSTLNLSEDFIYDANGNITNVNDLTTTGVRTKAFTYDALNRLSSATAANLYGTETYTYDALNNLRTRVTGGNTLTLNYDATNRLGSVAQNGSVVTQYGYDTQGNRNSLSNGGATTNYSFDAENQLLQVSGVEGYAYDAAGRRVAKTNLSGTATGYYFYDQAGQLMYSFDPNALTATNYVYLGTKLIAKHAFFAAPPPSAITFSANPNGGTFAVSWGAVTDATSYTLQQLNIAGGSWATVYTGTALTDAINSLAAGTYQYRVQACDSAGCGNWTTSSNVDVWPALPTVTVPTGTVAGTYTVSWSASANASSYTVQEAVNGSAWTTIGTQAATSITRPGTTTGTYTYQVEALDASGVTGGFGPTSNPVTVNAALLPSPTPTLSVPASTTTSSATISWSAASPVTTYTLQESANGGSTWATVYSGASTSAVVTGLADGTYTFQLQACNAPGTGTYCDNWVTGTALVVALPPDTPTITPSTTSSNTGAYSLSWTAEATTTNYVLQQQINGGAWTTLQSTAATTGSVSGEGNGTYGYRVQACYTIGATACSGWSATVSVTVLLPPASAPTVSAPATNNNGVYSVTWTTVSTATSYTLQQQVNGGAWSTVQSSAATSLAVSGEGSGTYGYQVQACNAGGCGPWSATSSVVVTLPPTTAPTLNVNRPNINSDTLDLSWTSVAGATYYWVQQSSNGTTYVEIIQTSALSTTTAPGSGTFYFEVQACNAGGCGPWSAAFKIEDVVK